MDHSDQLLTFAELAIALAGFSGIIATYQFKQEEHVSRGRVIGLSMIVNISLLAALFSVLPLALLNFGFAERSVWAISSGLAGIIWIAFTIYIGHNMSTYRVRKPVRILFAFLFFISAVASVILLLNAFGIILHQDYAPYFAAFLLAFLWCASTFRGYLCILCGRHCVNMRQRMLLSIENHLSNSFRSSIEQTIRLFRAHG